MQNKGDQIFNRQREALANRAKWDTQQKTEQRLREGERNRKEKKELLCCKNIPDKGIRSRRASFCPAR